MSALRTPSAASVTSASSAAGFSLSPFRFGLRPKAAALVSTKAQAGLVKPPLPPAQKGIFRRLRAHKAAASASAAASTAAAPTAAASTAAATPAAASNAAAAPAAAQQAANRSVRPRSPFNNTPPSGANSLVQNVVAAAAPKVVEAQLVAPASPATGSTAFGSPVDVASGSPMDTSSTPPRFVKALADSSSSPVLSPMDWQPTTPVQNVVASAVSGSVAARDAVSGSVAAHDAVSSSNGKPSEARPSVLRHLFKNSNRSAFAQQELQQHQLVSRINGQTAAGSPAFAYGIGSASFGVKQQPQPIAAAPDGNRQSLLLKKKTTSGKENVAV